MQQLAMAGGRFEVALQALDEGNAHGLEQVEFLVSAHASLAPKPLAKVASGGELSRISLAIQVVTSKVAAVPTLIFDEVDVGIGGGVAEIVGKMLRGLGAERQVLCITHLPQVAALGDQHWQVSKAAAGRSGVEPDRVLDQRAAHRGNRAHAGRRRNHRYDPPARGGDAGCVKLLSLVRTIFLEAVGVEIKRVLLNVEAAFLGDLLLAAFDFRIVKLFHQTALQAYQVVVVASLVEFEHRLATFEMVAHQQTGRFELGQDAVNRRQAHVQLLGKQNAIDVLCREVAHFAGLEQVENFQARQGGFEADVFQIVGLAHWLVMYSKRQFGLS